MATNGKLPNAPLAYVLAQIQFEPILELKSFVPKIQSALRADFPRFQELAQQAFAFGANGVMQQAASLRWEFLSASKGIGAIVLSDSLVLHATEYEDYDHFEECILKVASTFGEIVPHLLIKRIGLRYVDFLKPRENDQLDDYVVASMGRHFDLGVAYASYQSGTRIIFEMLEGKLVIQFARGIGTPDLPPDLLPLVLEPSDIMRRAHPMNREGGVLDWDRFVEANVPFTKEQLKKRFSLMHDDISKAFQSLTTDHARTVWNEVSKKS